MTIRKLENLGLKAFMKIVVAPELEAAQKFDKALEVLNRHQLYVENPRHQTYNLSSLLCECDSNVGRSRDQWDFGRSR